MIKSKINKNIFFLIILIIILIGIGIYKNYCNYKNNVMNLFRYANYLDKAEIQMKSIEYSSYEDIFKLSQSYSMLSEFIVNVNRYLKDEKIKSVESTTDMYFYEQFINSNIYSAFNMLSEHIYNKNVSKTDKNLVINLVNLIGNLKNEYLILLHNSRYLNRVDISKLKICGEIYKEMNNMCFEYTRIKYK